MAHLPSSLTLCFGTDEPVIALLHTMTASGVDFELRSLSKEREFEEFKLLLNFVLAQLKLCTNFEVIQSLLNVFLKVWKIPPSPIYLT